MQNSYNLSTRLSRNVRHCKFFQFLWNSSADSNHAAGLAPVTYLFTAIAFPCKWVLYAKFRLQGAAQIFGAEPFSAEKVVAAPWLPDCSRDCERSCEPRAHPLCRRPAGAKLCPETNTAEPRHASEWENESNITKEALCSFWDFCGVQFYPGRAQPDLQCCLLSKRLWWSLIRRSFSTRFLALNRVDTRQFPTHRCPKPSRLRTQPRQCRRKIMFWFLSHKNKHSFQVKPPSNRVLYSWSCSEPAAPTVLPLEAPLCLGWSSEGHIWHLEAQTFLASISSVTEGQTTCRIPDSCSRNHETQPKLVCNLISEGVFSPLKLFHRRGKALQHKWNMIILFA